LRQLGAVAGHVAATITTRQPTRRQRRGSTLDPVRFRPLDRNQRARLVFLAERYDAQTHEKGKHGGELKRTGLQVLKTLLFHFHNVHTGQCDPSYTTIAAAAGMARSAVAEAINRLEAAGIITRIRRARVVYADGRRRFQQWSNAYLLDLPKPFRLSEAAWYGAHKPCESGCRTQTTKPIKNNSLPPMPDALAQALARLGHAIADEKESGTAVLRP